MLIARRSFSICNVFPRHSSFSSTLNYSAIAFNNGRTVSVLLDPLLRHTNTNNINQTARCTPTYNCGVTVRRHGGATTPSSAPTITLVFVDPKLPHTEQTKSVTVHVGEILLRAAQRHEIELEGACEGVCACSTCHVILSQDLYSSLPEASEDEEDMLDMAFGLTETSRLACQIGLRKEMDGQVIRLPSATRNFYVDGHVPQPH